MMRLVNLDLVMYALIQAEKDLRKDKRKGKGLAKQVEVIAQHLQENLDEVLVERCPYCKRHFGLATEDDCYDEDT